MKRAIIVGATSGIGRGLAKLLVEDGYLVGITGRRSDLLSEIQKENPAQYLIKTLDINQTETIPDILEQLTLEMGGLDLLVISSGTGDINPELDFLVEKRTIDTNVLGFTAVADWTYNYFNKNKSGHLVAITSIAGLRGNRENPSYSASKAYQITYLEGLEHKACKSKLPIYITDIRPGFVDTPMAKSELMFWVSPVNKASLQIFKAIKRKSVIAYITKRWALIAFIFKTLPRVIFYRI